MLEHQRNTYEGCKFFNGPAQTFILSLKQNYFTITIPQIFTPNPLYHYITLFKKLVSFNPYKDASIQATSHPTNINIFLVFENWLDEVKGMSGSQMFTIGKNLLPEHQKGVQNTIDLWVSTLCSELESTPWSVKLNIGDYIKWVHLL